MTQNKQAPKLSKKQKKSNNSTADLTFLGHVYELRKRLFWVVLALVVTSAAGFQFKDQLISAVMAPLHGEKLIYLTPGGGFSFIFTLSLYFGALLTIPIAVYQIYRFLQPLLGHTSRRFVAILMTLSTLLAAAGAAFGYFVTIPAALNFLSTFAGDAIIPSLTAESYLNFVVAYVLGLAVLFQLPLILFLLDHIRPFPPGTLSSSQRFVIIGATVVAAVITPTPDAINMAIVAVPIVVIYEIGALAVFIRHRVGRKARSTQPSVVEDQVSTTDDEPLTAIIEELKPVANHLPQTPVLQPATHQRRTVDGFMVTRQAPAAVHVPSRQTVPVRLASQRETSSRQIRSTDGFLTV